VDDPARFGEWFHRRIKGDVVGLLGDIETLPVATDQPARIVIDEATGTVVMGEECAYLNCGSGAGQSGGKSRRIAANLATESVRATRVTDRNRATD